MKNLRINLLLVIVCCLFLQLLRAQNNTKDSVYIAKLVDDIPLKYSGTWLYCFGNGQTYIKRSYKKGVREGEALEYYENGQVSSKGNYMNGFRAGEWSTYSANGQLLSKEHYKICANGERPTDIDADWTEGIIEGECLYYYKSGAIESRGKYKMNELDGKWFYYSEGGTLIEKKIFKNGEEVKSNK